MAVVLKVDTKSKAALSFIEFVKSLSFVKIIQQDESDAYNPEFVNKILDADKNDKRVRINTKSVWDSI
jgi:hypothetical protein